MIDAHNFRDAMALLSTAVSVITTQGEAGSHGFTASAVCSVTDTPPTLLVCMNHISRSYAYFVDNKILSVNVLGAQHQHLSDAFASSMLSTERFEQGNWITLATGAPVLADALVSFDCKIEQMQKVGTHDIFICRVLAISQNKQNGQDAQEANAQSLVYFKRAYHRVG